MKKAFTGPNAYGFAHGTCGVATCVVYSMSIIGVPSFIRREVIIKRSFQARNTGGIDTQVILHPPLPL